MEEAINMEHLLAVQHLMQAFQHRKRDRCAVFSSPSAIQYIPLVPLASRNMKYLAFTFGRVTTISDLANQESVSNQQEILTSC